MTVTRTFGTKLLPAYAANTIVEIVHFRDMIFDADEQTAFYLDTANAVVDVGSFNIGKIPDLDGDETDIEKALAMSKAESLSNRVGLRFLNRKNNTGDWEEIAEFIILNYGRKDYLDLRGRLGYPAKIMEKNDALAVQLVDYGDGLLWDTDFIKIDIGVTIEISKKNDLQALTPRIAALELALEGKLINLPANTLLGRNAGTGTVEQIPIARFATPAMIDQAIIDLAGGAPGALNTLVELATAMNNDANFAASIANSLALKAPITNPIFTNGISLGSNNIRFAVKQITLTSAATNGASVNTPHNLSGSNILGALIKLVQSAEAGIGSDADSFANGFQFDWYHDATNFYVINSSTANNILDKPISILIFYAT